MQRLKTLYSIIGLGLFITAGIGVLSLMETAGEQSALFDMNDAPAESVKSPITITGEISCQPYGLECILVLYGEDGRYYDLQNINHESVIAAGGINHGQRVTVSGTLISPTPDIALRDYDIAGSIDIASYIAAPR